MVRISEMDFREFSTNYLNPIFLMYRVVLLTASFFIFLFSMPLFSSSASSGDMLTILIMSLVLSAGLYAMFRKRAYLLYLIIPCILVAVALTIRGDQVVQENVLKIPMAMCWASALLIAFNGFRSWGYGMSMHEINNKINSKLNDFQK